MTELALSIEEQFLPPEWCAGSAEADETQHEVWKSYDSFDFPRPKNFDLPYAKVLKQAQQLSLFVEMDDNVLGGTPRVDGTRIPVYMVLSAIEEYGSIESATRAYRALTVEKVRDALKFAVHVLEAPLEHQSSAIG